MKRFISIILFVVFCTGITAAKNHTFSFGKRGTFLMDGKPIQIISGELDPARIPEIHWENRIRMAKAMGLNAISMYVFWNYHEKTPGHFDFSTGNKNIAKFIKLCQKEGMWVLLRPGPYVCGEWDFGGLPPYLLKTPDIKVRCSDPQYLNAVKQYVAALSNQIRPLLCTNGGPIIMVQIENEYGSYGDDKSYLNKLKSYWIEDGINVPFFTADGPSMAMLKDGTVPGAAIGLDDGNNENAYRLAAKINPNVPAFSSEIYPGWLTHWGDKTFAKVDTASILKQVRFLLENKKSFSLYIVGGGTSFGFTSGANANSPTSYQPDITSYDYDAPINEQGQPTPKYFALRKLIRQYVSYKVPRVPKAPKAISIPPFDMQPLTSIWNNLPSPVFSVQPKPMEMFNQSEGFIDYRTKLVGQRSGILTITEPHDFALVLLNGHLVGTIFRNGGKWSVKIPQSSAKKLTLDILVESMGRINYGPYMIDRKGITNRVTLNRITLMNWNVFPLPMKKEFINTLKQDTTEFHNGVFFQGKFDLKHVGDTYLDMSKYGQGVVWVNGHNLGRFWKIGPQKHLYCPANFLKKGMNKVVVFDILQSKAFPISGVKTLN